MLESQRLEMPAISTPTSAVLPPSTLLPPSHPLIYRTLTRLTRPSLLSLALDWLSENNQSTCAPYLRSESAYDDEISSYDLYPPASSLEELRDIYIGFQNTRGTKRDALDRIIEGDWRHGFSLYMLAMADMQFFYAHPTSQKWTALELVPLSLPHCHQEVKHIPRFHPVTFLKNMQHETPPDVKAHFNIDRHPELPLLILRVWVVESPYDNSSAFFSSMKARSVSYDASRTFYIAFPDHAPFVYVSLTTTIPAAASSEEVLQKNIEVRSIRQLILQSIPKAFSKPRERYKLTSTNFSARNLEALVERKGNGRGNAAAGGWSQFAESKGERARQDNPLNTQLPIKSPEIDSEVDELALASNATAKSPKYKRPKRKSDDKTAVAKRRRTIAQGRFGDSARLDDGKGIERFDVRMEDPFPNYSVSEIDELQANSGIAPSVKSTKAHRSAIDPVLAVETDNDEGDAWRPDLTLTFHGAHVFAGVRDLVEAGIVDGTAMPGWMAGEDGVSFGVVRNGRIMGFKGTGV